MKTSNFFLYQPYAYFLSQPTYLHKTQRSIFPGFGIYRRTEVNPPISAAGPLLLSSSLSKSKTI